MERLTWVDEDGTVLFQQPNQFPGDVAYTIMELARNEEYDFLIMIAERLANREVAADYYKLKYEKKCAELAAERQKHRWIPWDGKNLPPEGELVEVTFKPKVLKTPCRDIGYYDRDREEWWKYDEDGLLDVIAWREPSEPYQPEKGGAEND